MGTSLKYHRGHTLVMLPRICKFFVVTGINTFTSKFYHPSAHRLFIQIRRANPWKSLPDLRELLDEAT